MANNINWGKIYGSTWWGNVTNSISWGKSYSSLAGTITTLASRFKERVLALGGIVESEECIDESVDASLYLKPTAFGNTKLFAALPEDGSGDMDFSRAGEATRVNAQGNIEEELSNIPRIDYTDGGCPSLLLEPQSTNLVQYSEDFSGSSWTNFRSAITSSQINTLTNNNDATLFYPLYNSVYMSLYDSSNLSLGIYTFSVFAKASGKDFLCIDDSFGGKNWFNLGNGTLGTINSSYNGNIQDFGNGWYRCSVTNNSDTAFSFKFIYVVADADNSTTITQNGVDGILLFGSQTEPLPYATSYIPNYGILNGITRSAETLTLDTTSLGLTTITETFADDSTNVITPVPSLYTASQGRIKQIIGE
jgi:hypothetical protein